MLPITFTRLSIRKLTVSSCPGVGAISPNILKLNDGFVSALPATLSRQWIDSYTVPPEWHHSHVVPICKSGSKINLLNYHTILLLKVPWQLMEHVLYIYTATYFVDNHNVFFFQNQHQFCKSHSCTTQLFEFITDHHHFRMHARKRSTVVFINFAKAIESVAHFELATDSFNCLESWWQNIRFVFFLFQPFLFSQRFL